MTTEQHLTLTKDLLRGGRGWAKYTLYDRMNDQRCLLGAMRKAEEITGWFPESYALVSGLVHDEGYHTIAAYNDSYTVQWRHIEKLLDTAIERCSDRAHG